MLRSALLPLAALALTLALPAVAQDSPPADATEAPAAGTETPAETGTPAEGEAEIPDADTGFSTGEPVIEGPVVAEVQGDWEVRCLTPEGGAEQCQIYQLLKEASGNNVAEITIVNLPAGGDAVAGATLVTPLGTLLTAAVTFAVDGGTPRRYPFNWCDQFGCYSRIGFLAAEIDQLRRGKSASLTIVPVVAPDQKVSIAVSLTGFTAAFAAMERLNTAAAAPVEGGN